MSSPAPDTVPTATETVLFVLRHRPRRGERWRKVAQVATRAEALDLARGAGDFWIGEVRTPELAAGLFDGIAETAAGVPR